MIRQNNYYCPPMKLREGNVFVPVCLSTGGMADPPTCWTPPKRAVRILLECTLVGGNISTYIALSHLIEVSQTPHHYSICCGSCGKSTQTNFGCMPPPRSNFLHFHAVFRKVWPIIGYATLGNPGSVAQNLKNIQNSLNDRLYEQNVFCCLPAYEQQRIQGGAEGAMPPTPALYK